MEWPNINAKRTRKKPSDQQQADQHQDDHPRSANQPRPPFSPKHFPSHLILLSLVGLFLLWLATGFYIVGPDEIGMVQRFGQFINSTEPGLHYHLPTPIEEVQRPKLKEIQRLEIGFRTIDPGPPARYREIPLEALMLTGDENIVNINCIVQYQIQDPGLYLYKIRDQEKTVRESAESALREIVGQNKIEHILTTGKYQVQDDAQKLLKNILDKYETGLRIITVELQDVHPPDEVMDAFKDVASAKEDKNKLIDEAHGYNNDELPKARGEAAKIIAEAEGHRDEIIRYAEGDTSRFIQNYNEYKNAKEITLKRMYLETMESILPNVEKYIMEKSGQGQGVLGILPLGRDFSSFLKQHNDTTRK